MQSFCILSPVNFLRKRIDEVAQTCKPSETIFTKKAKHGIKTYKVSSFSVDTSKDFSKVVILHGTETKVPWTCLYSELGGDGCRVK
jgi:hypothetical protein